MFIDWFLIISILALAFYAAYCAAYEKYPEDFAEYIALGVMGCTILLGLHTGIAMSSMLIMGLLFMSAVLIVDVF